MIDAIQRATFEAPFTVACGPEAAAVLAGFAVYIGPVLCLTPAGERYLATQTEENQE